ncbi:uncharacterized protein An04g08470 [Aspergillus niger]|uniref:Contig An04c0270, genomic contig n=2 Tax=Aspergillus niger TaxID=5061 RepID=A2QJW2_ASPNC|nr:uncharacterized protein An04g08470 [Aspergillus niger]CAK38934.1 unnamed protein product [Aspergillus niger]
MLGIRHVDWPNQAILAHPQALVRQSIDSCTVGSLDWLQHHATTPKHSIGPNPGTTTCQQDDSPRRSFSSSLRHAVEKSTCARYHPVNPANRPIMRRAANPARHVRASQGRTPSTPSSSTTNSIIGGGSPTHLSWQCLLEHAPPQPKKASVFIRYRECRLG